MMSQCREYELADRICGHVSSHHQGGLTIMIAQQTHTGIPPNIRRLMSHWFLFPRRIAPLTLLSYVASVRALCPIGRGVTLGLVPDVSECCSLVVFPTAHFIFNCFQACGFGSRRNTATPIASTM